MNRVHILETKKLEVSKNVFKDKHLTIHCLNPIEIYAAKICALLDRTTARDLFDVYTLSKYDLFDKEEKILLRQCFMLEYIAVCGYKLENMKIDNIEKLKRQDIKTKLLPTLKDRNPKKSNVDEMKKSGRVVLLTASPETILEHVKHSHDRPLLENNKNVEYIAELMEKRKSAYESAADIVISTDGKSVYDICEEIITKVNE